MRKYRSALLALVLGLLVLVTGGCTLSQPATVEAPVAAQPVTLLPGQTHTFASGSTVKYEVEPYTYPKTLGGYPVTDKAALNGHYVLVRLTYTNTTPEPRGMSAMMMGAASPSGNQWGWTLGVPMKTADGAIRSGKTGVYEAVYAAPETEPGATEAFGTMYEPWRDGTALFTLMANGTPPESVEFTWDTTKL